MFAPQPEAQASLHSVIYNRRPSPAAAGQTAAPHQANAKPPTDAEFRRRFAIIVWLGRGLVLQQ